LTEYKSYHTNLVLLHKFNSLPDEFKSIIPNSTLSGWNNRNVAKIIGCDSLADKDINLLSQIVTSKKLLVAAKALYFVFSTVSTLFKHANNKAELLKDNKQDGWGINDFNVSHSREQVLSFWYRPKKLF